MMDGVLAGNGEQRPGSRPVKAVSLELQNLSRSDGSAESLLLDRQQSDDVSPDLPLPTERSMRTERSEGGGPKCCGILDVLQSSFLSVLLIFVPVAIVAWFFEDRIDEHIHFWVNFVAIIPLAWLIGKSTEDLSGHTGQVASGLLNATFGNVVEMLLCVSGLYRDQLVVVQCTLLGSILSNLLLVLGTAFMYGGIFYSLQKYSAIGAMTNTSLLSLSCMAVALPTMYGTVMASDMSGELNMSRCLSLLIMFMYLQYLYFQLNTHTYVFSSTSQEEEEEPDLTPLGSATVLGISTIVVSFCADNLIRSIEGTVHRMSISKEFIGIILLPIIGNAAEHYTAIVVAGKNKLDLTLGVAVGSSCQMALFVTPFCVIVGWIMQVPFTLNFHPFQVLIMILSVFIVTGIVQDGCSNWLEGSMLVTAYVAIAMIYWFEEPKTDM